MGKPEGRRLYGNICVNARIILKIILGNRSRIV
jgi:hypothetical protein